MSESTPDYTQPGTYLIPTPIAKKIRAQLTKVQDAQNQANAYTFGVLDTLGFDGENTKIAMNYDLMTATVTSLTEGLPTPLIPSSQPAEPVASPLPGDSLGVEIIPPSE